ncbi:twin-arginine translocation signal domain-containing protein [Azospirillum sp.]|uniref:twin-arginine translocation signal domain-containing protein n=1 Tax=Azospirillum sp. TaxID=34012 RepID=UPI003D732EE1
MTTETTGKTTGIDRRDLLKGLGLGAAGAAALSAAPAAEAAETPQKQVKPRYAETDHVKRFYALNRL